MIDCAAPGFTGLLEAALFGHPTWKRVEKKLLLNHVRMTFSARVSMRGATRMEEASPIAKEFCIGALHLRSTRRFISKRLERAQCGRVTGGPWQRAKAMAMTRGDVARATAISRPFLVYAQLASISTSTS